MSTSERLMQDLGMTCPIIQAPMAVVSTPGLAAAVSEAGGLGSLALGADSIELARSKIAKTQALTKRAFNVNVFCHAKPKRDKEREEAWLSYLSPQFGHFNQQTPTSLHEIYHSFLDNPAMLALFLEMKPPVVSFHFNVPSANIITQLKNAGIYTMATATNLQEALLIEEAGVDAIVAQGIEAGGHRGMFDVKQSDDALSTLDLVALLVKHVTMPVIATGGIMTGQDIRLQLSHGAAAAQLGTAFILCPESAASDAYRQILKSEKNHETMLTAAISGRPARGMVNQFTNISLDNKAPAMPDYPIAYDVGKQLNAAAAKAGSADFAAHWAGEGVALIREMPAAMLLKTLLAEMQ